MFADAQKLSLTRPQFALATSMAQFPALVAGFGSGKTEALAMRAIFKKTEYVDLNTAYYLPTFDLVKQIAIPRFDEKFEQYKIRAKLNKQSWHYDFAFGEGRLIFRTMDTPRRIIGYEVADSLVDELDTLKEADARIVWQKIIARNRQKKPDGKQNTVAVGTTPEGFRFVYKQWQQKQESLPPEQKRLYKLFHASSYSNQKHLPEGYIESLLDTYPENLVSAYIEGQFVNLTTGSVYPLFSRTLNACSTEITPTDALRVGMDFNVGNMTAQIAIVKNVAGVLETHFCDEIIGVLDTPNMILAIKRKYPNNKQIFVYPDASGQSRKSNNASQSDVSLLQGANFNVVVKSTNPAVKDRVLSMNMMIGKHRFKVNLAKCPVLVQCLEQQAYDKNGEPDKKTGLDHSPDAAGYFISSEFPVVRASSQRMALSGV